MASNTSAAEAVAPRADTTQPTNDSSAAQPAPQKTSADGTDGNATNEKSALEPSLPITTGDKEAASAQIDDEVNPPDFQGEVLTNNELPSPETIRRIGDYIVLDRHGKTHTFKSLYTGRNVARRVLIIFVRHFFCGVSSNFLPSRVCEHQRKANPSSVVIAELPRVPSIPLRLHQR